MKMVFAGLDPAMNNTGIAIGSINLRTAAWSIEALKLVQPPKLKKEMKKVIRKSSDDLARMRHTHSEVLEFLKLHGVQMVFAEVPSGGQSARAAYGFGSATMMLASLPMPVVEVTPVEVKLAVGERWASKEYMIEWATNRWPDLPWLTRKLKGKLVPIADNEHLADACGVIQAGLKTQEFKAAFAMHHTLLKAGAEKPESAAHV